MIAGPMPTEQPLDFVNQVHCGRQFQYFDSYVLFLEVLTAFSSV